MMADPLEPEKLEDSDGSEDFEIPEELMDVADPDNFDDFNGFERSPACKNSEKAEKLQVVKFYNPQRLLCFQQVH